MNDGTRFAIFPARIALSLKAGKLGAAERLLLQKLPTCALADQAQMAWLMAQAWYGAQDASRALRWLARIPDEAALPIAVEAARLAAALGDCALACRWFDRAFSCPEAVGLTEADRLAYGQSALAAAERCRLPRGRQGSWQRHLALLRCSERILGELAASTANAELQDQARYAHDRVCRLLGAGRV